MVCTPKMKQIFSLCYRSWLLAGCFRVTRVNKNMAQKLNFLIQPDKSNWMCEWDLLWLACVTTHHANFLLELKFNQLVQKTWLRQILQVCGNRIAQYVSPSANSYLFTFLHWLVGNLLVQIIIFVFGAHTPYDSRDITAKQFFKSFC